MKYLLVALLFISTRSFAQTPAPSKGATAIIVHLPDSAAAAYKKAAQSLLAAGYMLDKTDKELGTVNTKPKAIGTTFTTSLQAASSSGAAGTDITFRGQFTWGSAIAMMTGTNEKQNEIRYIGIRGPVQQMWDEMERVAKQAFPTASISYK